jgi:ATP-dependent Lhr-like helicase
MLGDDLDAWLNGWMLKDVPQLRGDFRADRERFPGQGRAAITVHRPDRCAEPAARHPVERRRYRSGLLDVGAERMLSRIRGRIMHKALEGVSPLRAGHAPDRQEMVLARPTTPTARAADTLIECDENQ